MATNQAKTNKTTFLDAPYIDSVVQDVDIAANSLNKSLIYQWKIQFNNKQAIQVIFSQRKDAIIHLSVFLHGSEVAVKSEHKIISMYSILSSIFKAISIRQALIKATRGTGIISYLSKFVSRGVLDQIYMNFMCDHTCIMMIIYHKYDPEFKFFKLDFSKKLESIQYSAALAVTEAWRGTNTDRLCEEVGREILYYRKWYRCLCHFINCGIIRDRITYVLKYDNNVSF